MPVRSSGYILFQLSVIANFNYEFPRDDCWQKFIKKPTCASAVEFR